MPGEHAILSPSSAERWISCPASVGLVAGLDLGVESESPYALEGTIAHRLAELKALFHFGQITAEQYMRRRATWRKDNAALLDEDEYEIEMERHTEAYVSLLQDRMNIYPYSQIMLEQRLDTGVPGCWGTSDAVIVSPAHVEIVDFKYGRGYAVQAEGNPQLRLYACGAMDTYADILGETEAILLTVHQPRLDHTLTDLLSPTELRAWRDEVATPAAIEAMGELAHYGPSETACRWCPASGRCRAQLEAVFAEPFELPPTLTPVEVAATLARVPEIREWLKAFEETALTMAYSEGVDIPGYKVVLSGGRRSFEDPEGAIAALTEKYGYDPAEITKTTIRGLGEFEKLMGEDKFAELCGPYLTRSEGKPALVPDHDKRPATSPDQQAIREFTK